jgi:hypothetical protein
MCEQAFKLYVLMRNWIVLSQLMNFWLHRTAGSISSQIKLNYNFLGQDN